LAERRVGGWKALALLTQLDLGYRSVDENDDRDRQRSTHGRLQLGPDHPQGTIPERAYHVRLRMECPRGSPSHPP
jgi:hypothetical protein